MKASVIRKNDKLMYALDLVARGRDIKTHNFQGGEPHPTEYEKKWMKYRLGELYKNPSQTKIEIDRDIRMNVADVFTVLRPWVYRGNCMSFSMDTVIEYEGMKYGLTFTKDNLHVVGYDY